MYGSLSLVEMTKSVFLGVPLRVRLFAHTASGLRRRPVSAAILNANARSIIYKADVVINVSAHPEARAVQRGALHRSLCLVHLILLQATLSVKISFS
ncbi:MAG: hypothetical protein JWQ34_1761 [Mucilaginibacter sp.]|nr:hypothetical protein [Mucilaginibacter sp.]